MGGGREVRGEAAEQRARGVERVAERRDRPARADEQQRQRRPRPAARRGAAASRGGASARAPVRGERQARQQHERVHQVDGHEQRARDRLVVGHQAEQHQAGADRGLAQDEQHRRRGRPARGVPGGPRAEHAEGQETTSSSATPLVARCVNSIIVASAGARGSTSPLQSGQCAPQPAPEPVARTKAPHRMTAMFQPRTSQASRASGVVSRAVVTCARRADDISAAAPYTRRRHEHPGGERMRRAPVSSCRSASASR